MKMMIIAPKKLRQIPKSIWRIHAERISFAIQINLNGHY